MLNTTLDVTPSRHTTSALPRLPLLNLHNNFTLPLTSRRVVLDAQIDVLINAKAEVA